MALHTDEEWANKSKPKVPTKQEAKPVTPAHDPAIKAIEGVTKEIAEQAKQATEAVRESLVATNETAKQLLALVAKLSDGSPPITNEPQPVRLVVNRKNRLIESIDVIPLVRKTK